MKTSEAGVALIKEFEGFPAGGRIYNDIAGVPTVGYGHIEGVHPGAIWVKGQKTPGRLTQAEADKLLRDDLAKHYEPTINALRLPLNQNQYDALVSFVYNVGVGGVGSNTQVGHALRERAWNSAADHLLDWSKARVNGQTVVVQGLLRRRKEERALFLKGVPVLVGYTKNERAWIKEYDALVRARKDVARRRELRALMTAQRKAIWREAQKSGWDIKHRKERYRSLKARTS